VNDQTSVDAGHVQDLPGRLFVIGRDAKSTDRQQQSGSQAKPPLRYVSVLNNCCNLLNKFHIANLISI
jgi:hypothetical protein